MRIVVLPVSGAQLAESGMRLRRAAGASAWAFTARLLDLGRFGPCDGAGAGGVPRESSPTFERSRTIGTGGEHIAEYGRMYQ
jgi:hypothetical protein